jgi:hypothetical protein
MNLQKTFEQKIVRLCTNNNDFAKVWAGLHQSTGFITGRFIRQILDETPPYQIELITDDDIQLPNYKMEMKKTLSFVQQNGTNIITSTSYSCPNFTLSIPDKYDWKKHADISVHKLYYNIKSQSISHYNNQKIRRAERVFQEIREKKYRIHNDKNLSANADYVVGSMIDVVNNGYQIDLTDKTTCENIVKILTCTTLFDYFDSNLKKFKLVKQILRFSNIRTIDYALHIASVIGDLETFQIINWEWKNPVLISVCRNLIRYKHNDLLDKLNLMTQLENRIPCQIQDMIFQACESGNLPALQIIEKNCKSFWSNFRYIGKCCDPLCYIARQDDVKLLEYVEQKGLLDGFREKKSEAMYIALLNKNMNVVHWLFNRGFQVVLTPDNFYGCSMWGKEFFNKNNHEALYFCQNELGVRYGRNELYYTINHNQKTNLEFLLTECHIKYRVEIKDLIFDAYLTVRQDKEWLLMMMYFKKLGKVRAMMYHILKAGKRNYRALMYFLLDGRLPSHLIEHIGKFV